MIEKRHAQCACGKDADGTSAKPSHALTRKMQKPFDLEWLERTGLAGDSLIVG
jgi:hypothetical protein